MRTRRQVLSNLAVTPFAAAFIRHGTAAEQAEPQIIPESHCLSEESARGFRLLLERNRALLENRSTRLVVIPGARQLRLATALALVEEATRGAWVIFEDGTAFTRSEQAIPQMRVLKYVFGIGVQPTVAIGERYIEYLWPLHRLVRHFNTFTPIECLAGEAIAYANGATACAKRHIGKGGIIYLGSMLGPGLVAEEREAHELGTAILKWISG